MRALPSRPAVPFLTLAFVLAGGCTDPQAVVAPELQPSVTTMAKPGGLAISSSTPDGEFVIDGDPESVSFTVDNPAKSGYSNTSVQLTLTQGPAHRELGRFLLDCENAAPGMLPGNSTCSFSVEATVLSTGGTGTLQAGPAMLVSTLVQTNGKKDKVLASSLEGVTLVEASSPGGDPSITYFRLHSTTIPLAGAAQYSITIRNPRATTLSPVVVQAELRQGGQILGAGGTNVQCPDLNSGLPPGDCSFSWQASIPSSVSTGAATLDIQLIYGGEIIDSRSVAVTLTQPGAHIWRVNLSATTLAIGDGTAYTIRLANPGEEIYPATVQAFIGQGTSRRGAGGTQTQCPTYTAGTLPTTTNCAFGYVINASNDTDGVGTLVPGPAVLTIELRDFFGVLHVWEGDITLVSGGT